MCKESYVYMLTNHYHGTLYIGVTSNLPKRVYQHKNKIVPGFATRYELDRLVYFEDFNSIENAILREKQLKRWKRTWKIDLIESMNPEWKYLYDSIL